MIRSFGKLFVLLLLSAPVLAQQISVAAVPNETRVEIRIDGQLFTSYRWDEKIRRPVFLPVMTAGGNFLTRGFPLETRNGETIGHPHQVGMSLSYGDVNKSDFWNNSTFRTAKELERMGRIVHRRIVKMKGGKGRGELITESDWLMPDGRTVLRERTRFVFRANGATRSIERETKLTAVNEKVAFGDNKEGFFAIHLARELQQSDQFPVKITDEKGVISDASDGSNLTGKYFNSRALEGNKIWGTRAEWAAVSGVLGKEDVTVAVFDHPRNHGFPSAMMVRGYGLLALNPFGAKAFDPSAPEARLELVRGKAVLFRHLLMISAGRSSVSAIAREYGRFAQE